MDDERLTSSETDAAQTGDRDEGAGALDSCGPLQGDIYRTIFEISPEAIVLTDHKGVFVASNGRMWEWLGYSPEEVLGKNILQAPFIPGPSKVAIVKNFMRRMGGLSIPPYELEFITKSGEKRHGRIQVSVVRDERGKARGELVMISDVTEHRKIEFELQQSRRKIEGLHETARQLLACQTLEEVCDVTVGATVNVLGFQTCVAYQAIGDNLVIMTGCSALPPCIDMDSTPTDASLAMEAHCTQKTILFGPGGASSCPSDPDLFMSGVCVPVEGSGVFEVLSVDRDAFSPEDVRLLELLLGHTTEALRSIRLREELREQVIRDPLTGLYNRRYLSTIVAQEAERSRRYGHRIGFLMVDVDNFKEINDTMGHSVGDLVLRQVSRFLRAMVRATEYAVRYGGDEFLLVMPENEGDGESVISRLQRAFGPWSEELPTGHIPLRLSMGFDRWEPADRRPMEDVIASADEKMYEDKRRNGTGRSAAVTSDSAPSA